MKGRKKKQILLLEDEEILADLIKLQLEKEGYAVEIMRRGKEGLEFIQKSPPDIVLLDMLLPDIKGFDLLGALRSKGILPKLPVIVLSNSGEPLEIDRIRSFGVRDYLIKVNFSPQEVADKVARVFEAPLARKLSPRERKKGSAHVWHVLLVEDDPTMSETLAQKFIQRKYKVSKTMNTQEAKKVLERDAVDIILLDLILPDVSGFSFLEELKRDARFKDIPVMIISNLGQQEEVEHGLNLGAIDYIVKANTVPGEIVEKVERFLNGQ